MVRAVVVNFLALVGMVAAICAIAVAMGVGEPQAAEHGYTATQRAAMDALVRHVNHDKGVMVRMPAKPMVLWHPKNDRERALAIADLFEIDVRGQ